MHFVNILRTKTAYIYQKNGVLSLVEASLVIAKNQKNFTTTLYVVEDFYNPFSGRAEMPGFEDEKQLKTEEIMTILDKKMAQELLNNGRNHVIIPDFVTEIGEGAFKECRELISVVIPKSVTKIGMNAFAFCEGLTSVVIPNSVTEIEDGAFNVCCELQSVVIPDSLIEISKFNFYYCEKLRSIAVGKNNPRYDSRGDCNAIIETVTNTLIKGCSGTIIPDTVTKIGERAFDNCRGLTYVTIPKSVTKIEERAFLHCDDLKFVNIENSEIQIEKYAFCRCRNISEESKKRLKELGYDFDEE